MKDSERIDALETQIAFQDATIQQLGDALIAQQARLDALEAKLLQLAATRSNDGERIVGDEKPPHY